MDSNTRLIQKYNVPGPRYTSYPTAVQFSETDDPSALLADLNHRYRQPRELSLYFHIPFCFSLCWYCGCTKIITKDQDRGDLYLDYLEKEMDLIADYLQEDSPVIQIHFGGGTPTFLRPEQLLRLGSMIRKRFRISEDVEFSVEIDPRSCSEEHVQALSEIGCNRASLGIQDTNTDVQEAVHRIQPMEMNRNVVNWLRQNGIEALNFDLIYGLPRQTPETFKQTIEEVIELDPDRLAVYSYAHIPNLMPSQKLLNEDEFPTSEEKIQMIRHSVETFPKLGYRFIGMDHFAKESDELTKALDEGTLHRNFQGYSTRSEADMIAFGMSGISQVDFAYFQNTKDLGNYYRLLDEQKLPIIKTLRLSEDDKIRRDLIMQVMCRAEVNFTEFSEKWSIRFKEYFQQELNQLDRLESDGLIIRLTDKVQITEQGRLFLRNIAMVFDAYLHQPGHEKRYSKTV